MTSTPNNVIINEDAANRVVVSQEPANNVLVREDTASQVIVNQDAPNQVVIRLATSSGNTRRLVFSQPVPAVQWTVGHTLGGRPSVTVVDSAGTVVVGEVTYNSDSQVTINFTAAFSGYAYLT
jgi:hypothetical protein